MPLKNRTREIALPQLERVRVDFLDTTCPVVAFSTGRSIFRKEIKWKFLVTKFVKQ
jgi:hypothetical protein